MTDQTIPADKVREILEEWERIKEYADWDDIDNLVQQLTALLPPPTLADMTEEERAACQWMQCEVHGKRQIITLILDDSDHNHAVTLDPSGYISRCPLESVTPRPDLPRLEWPGTEKPAPSPALPEGWRVADHVTHGRGVVTTPTPNSDGRVCFVIPCGGPLGYNWHLCYPDELTYLDGTDQEAEAPAPAEVGDLIESADDPRLAALPVGTVLIDCDGESVAKRGGDWAGLGYIPIESEGDEFGPWTVRRIGLVADQ